MGKSNNNDDFAIGDLGALLNKGDKKNPPNVESIINSAGATAEFMKITFDAYIKAGFSEEQALDLTKWMVNLSFGLA